MKQQMARKLLKTVGVLSKGLSHFQKMGNMTITKDKIAMYQNIIKDLRVYDDIKIGLLIGLFCRMIGN